MPKSLAREPCCVVFQKMAGSEKDYGFEGFIEIFRRKDFCLGVPNVSYGKISVLCFRKVPVARNSMDKRGGYQFFPSKLFRTTMPKTLAREPFCVVSQKTSCSEQDYG